jgi:hypothetical protein
MSFKHGKGTNVWVDAVDLSAYFHSADFTADVDTAETTTFTNDWKTFLPGLAGAEISLEGYFDPTQVVLTGLLPATANLITVGVGGGAVGDVARLASGITTSYGESAPVGGIVGLTWSLMANAAAGVKRGRILKPMAAITADANGTSVDGGSQTTTGALAQVHCSAVSSGDVVDVTIEDSATGSSGWATIGTFTQITAASAQRIVIAGTVKRYTRAVWDETDNGDPSLTFGVSFART